MTLISITCFSSFLFLAMLTLIKKIDAFSPAKLFVMIWLIAIGLSDLKLSRYQLSWSTYSWLTLLSTIISFMVGVLVVYVIFSGAKLSSVAAMREKIKLEKINHALLFRMLILLFFVYISSYVLNVYITGYIPIFTLLPSESRVGWGIFGIGLLIHLSPPILFFSAVYLYMAPKLKTHKFFVWLIITITISSNLFLLQRFDIVFGLLLIFVFLYYASRKVSFRNILISLLIFSTVMYGVSSIRASKSIANIIYVVSKMKYSSQYAIFTEPYMYVSMNVENFMNAVNKLDTYSYGYFTFDFLLALTGLKHWILQYSNIQEFPHLITHNYNTYTMFFVYYRDFGFAGIAFFPFILGLLISKSYYLLRVNPTLNRIAIYSVFVFIIIFSFFIPMLNWLHFIMNFTVIIAVSRMLQSSNNVKE